MKRGRLALLAAVVMASGALGWMVGRDGTHPQGVRTTVTEVVTERAAPSEPVFLLTASIFPEDGEGYCFYPDDLSRGLRSSFVLKDANTDAIIAVGTAIPAEGDCYGVFSELSHHTESDTLRGPPTG